MFPFYSKRGSYSTKKAFTLVELSVVLLVLAFLVGGILISKKIVDRSKGQSIINDLEQMKKAVNLFYDSYGYLPGDIPQNIIKDYPELSSKYLNNCPYAGLCASSSSLYSINNGYVEMFESCYASRMLETAGFISNVPNTTVGGNAICDYGSTTNIQSSSADFRVNTKKLKSSKDVAIFLINGINVRNVTSANGNAVQGYSLSTGSTADSLFSELAITGGKLGSNNAIYNTNFIALFGVADYKLAAVTSTVASYVDKKYDDGLPYSGDLVSGMVATSLGATLFSPNAMCTTLANSCITSGTCTTANLASAEYQTAASNSLAQGCNMYLEINVIK
jgi:prepilin-type N-terminal cleavage/methylation domain-containing protein